MTQWAHNTMLNNRADIHSTFVSDPEDEDFPHSASSSWRMEVSSAAASVRSSSIPMPASHVPRTQSELQLSMDEETARRRELSMFYRLVNGIRARQSSVSAPPPSTKNNASQVPMNLLDIQRGAYRHQIYESEPASHSAGNQGISQDEWSISGFDTADAIQQQPLFPQQFVVAGIPASFEGAMEDDLEEGVFSLDL